MGAVDYLIFGIYMAGILGIGIYFYKKNKTKEDYYVGSRSISPVHIGLSIAATDVGGYLATITSLAENEFAFELVSNDLDYWFNSDNGFSIGPWLGGYQASGAREPSGDWRWVTHPDESFTTFTNWLPGQPNDSGLLNQQSLHFIGRGGDNPSSSWNDLNGITPEHPIRGYIVETIPEPSTLTLLTIGAVGLLAGGWWLANSSS